MSSIISGAVKQSKTLVAATVKQLSIVDASTTITVYGNPDRSAIDVLSSKQVTELQIIGAGTVYVGHDNTVSSTDYVRALTESSLVNEKVFIGQVTLWAISAGTPKINVIEYQ